MKTKFSIIFLYALGMLSAQIPEENLINNPSFEMEWRFTGPVKWSGESIVEDKEQKASGEKSAKIYAQVRNDNTLTQYGIPITGGDTYTLSYKVLDNTTRSSLQSNVIWLNERFISRIPGIRSKDNEDWQTITEDFTAPSEATKANLQFRISGHRGSSTDQIYINIDDVILIKKNALSTTDAERLKEEVKISNTRVKDSFTLSLKGDAQVSIINMSGQQVLSEKIRNHHTFNVSFLPKGLYIVMIKKAQSSISKKIIIQ